MQRLDLYNKITHLTYTFEVGKKAGKTYYFKRVKEIGKIKVDWCKDCKAGWLVTFEDDSDVLFHDTGAWIEKSNKKDGLWNTLKNALKAGIKRPAPATGTTPSVNSTNTGLRSS